MKEKGKSKVLIYDIETAGVQGLCADRGFVVCFGYKWAGDKSVHCLTLNEYPGKHCHDDSTLLREAAKIMNSAYSIVAHYGAKFDRPYLEARFLKAGLPPIANTRQVDTCLIAKSKLKLSSNRLGNLADFLKCDTRKMDKRGGWPDWWLGALRGEKSSIVKISAYCKQDVQCLEEVYFKMRTIIPGKYLFNESIGKDAWTCAACGGHRKQDRGYDWSEMKCYKRYMCMACGRWARSKQPVNTSKFR